jgi:hypothetical protein
MMSCRARAIATILVGLSLAYVGCSRSTDPFESGIRVPAEYERCAAIVDDYTVRTHSWDPASYRITVDRTSDATTVFVVTYALDETATSPGGGDSFEVFMDCATNRITKVLQFQ